MIKKSLKIVGAAVAIGAVVAGCASIGGEPDAQWADYKNWTKITEGRVSTGDPTGFLGGVHAGPSGYRDIFVNDVGLATNQGSAPYNYPVGTVLVKEQYKNEAAWKAGDSPGITIMVKVAESTSPDAANWAYTPSYTGKAGPNQFCAGCHSIAAESDFVFTHEDFFNTL